MRPVEALDPLGSGPPFVKGHGRSMATEGHLPALGPISFQHSCHARSLQVFAVVLGVTQIALGLQVILHSLCTIGVLSGCTS